MPDGALVSRERGTAQGSVVSPVLANLFLHYALDLFARLPNLRCYAYLRNFITLTNVVCKSRLWCIRRNALFSVLGGANGKPSCGRGMKTFGEVISELRKERGLTQKALAAQVKKKDGIAIGIAYINDIEHDRRNPPSPDFVAQLAAALGVPLEVLQYYAGRLPSDKKTGDPSHEQIVAAYRAFRREIDKRRR
jgi:transcriptional regulator with XRE-family HTH domain